jgi:RNA polymerase sigma-70 factor (ECF subfamily)
MSENPGKKRIQDRDTPLIQAINNGQVHLFQDLVKRYERQLYNFGRRLCGDASDAEDMVQDAFLNAFRYLKNFRFETKFRNWLYRVALSACLKKKRKSKFAPERELSLDEFLPKDEAAIPTELPGWAAQPLDQVLTQELSDTINEAIVELPENYRMVMVLRDIEGFSTSETAHILNLSEANVKVRLHRARLFLKDALKIYFDQA